MDARVDPVRVSTSGRSLGLGDVAGQRGPGSYLFLAVCGELLAEGPFDNDLLILVPGQDRRTTNNECQEVK